MIDGESMMCMHVKNKDLTLAREASYVTHLTLKMYNSMTIHEACT